MNALNKQMEMFEDLPKQKKVKAASGGALMTTEKGKTLPTIAELTDAYNIFRADRDSAKLTVDEMDAILESFLEMKSAGKSFAEGGLEDGGLKDEGGETDPVSGNDVPPGSTKEEVRDDIPAQLSEGEFVFPADVVRYIGLENLMRMRQQAKQGLKMMEAMGQMGNSEDAIIPDDLPFGITDLIIVDTDNDDVKEMQVGGMATGTTTSDLTGTYQVPSISQPLEQQPIDASSSQFEMPSTYKAPEQQFTPTMGQETRKFGEYLKTTQDESASRIVTIINPDTGQEMQINFIPGVTTIPEGFILKSEYEPEEKVTTTPTTTQTTRVVEQSDEESPPDDGLGPGGRRIGWGGSPDPKRPGLKTGATKVGVVFKSGRRGPVTAAKDFITGTQTPVETPSVDITLNNQTINIPRAKYDKIKEKGFMGEEADAILEGLVKKDRVDRAMKEVAKRQAAIEKARKKAEAAKTAAAAAKAREEQEAAERAAVAAVQNAYFAQTGSDESGDQYTAESYAKEVGTIGPDDYTTSTGYGIGAKGGLFEKDKMTFHKQMKQSGLASKK